MFIETGGQWILLAHLWATEMDAAPKGASRFQAIDGSINISPLRGFNLSAVHS